MKLHHSAIKFPGAEMRHINLALAAINAFLHEMYMIECSHVISQGMRTYPPLQIDDRLCYILADVTKRVLTTEMVKP